VRSANRAERLRREIEDAGTHAEENSKYAAGLDPIGTSLLLVSLRRAPCPTRYLVDLENFGRSVEGDFPAASQLGTRETRARAAIRHTAVSCP
jgi:hypothetical protein